MKKVLIFLLSLLLITGCTNNKFFNNYNKMQAGGEGINGYTLDLRINGVINNMSINEMIKVDNYKNKDYKITITNLMALSDDEKEDIIYVKNNHTYSLDKYELYNLVSYNVNYDKPTIYLEGLKGIAKINKSYKETIGTLTYNIYNVTFTKSIIEKIISDTSLSNMNISNDVSGKIYINEDGYVYRIIYNIDNVIINANYYGINTASKISFPNEMITK